MFYQIDPHGQPGWPDKTVAKIFGRGFLIFFVAFDPQLFDL